MRVKALRGVCIGVDRHLKAGDSADLDAAMVTFLKSIGAVEIAPDEPKKPEPVQEVKEPESKKPEPVDEKKSDEKPKSKKEK